MDRRAHSLLFLTVQMAFALFATGSVRADGPQVAPSDNVVVSVPSTYLRRGDSYHIVPGFGVPQWGPERAASVSSTWSRGTQRSKGLVPALLATLAALTAAIFITICFKLLGKSKKSTPAVRRLAGDDAAEGGSCGEGDGAEVEEDALEKKKREAVESILGCKKQIEREKRELEDELEGEEDKDAIFLRMARVEGFKVELKELIDIYAKEIGVSAEELKKLAKEEGRRRREEEGEQEEVKAELGEEEKEALKQMAIEALIYSQNELDRERKELKKLEEGEDENAIYERSRRVARLEFGKRQLGNSYAKKLGMSVGELKQLVKEEIIRQKGGEGDEEEVEEALGEEEMERLKQRAIKFLIRGKEELKEHEKQLKRIEEEGSDRDILGKRRRIACFKLENKQMRAKYAKRLGMTVDELRQMVKEERKN